VNNLEEILSVKGISGVLMSAHPICAAQASQAAYARPNSDKGGCWRPSTPSSRPRARRALIAGVHTDRPGDGAASASRRGLQSAPS